MITQHEITLSPRSAGFHLITDEIFNKLPELPEKGLINLFIKHTSCAITINENCDPTVRTDMKKFFDNLVPENLPYFEHTAEGPDDMPAHIKSVLTNVSLTIPIKNRRPDLGTWQGIYLCEFRNLTHTRNITVTIYS